MGPNDALRNESPRIEVHTARRGPLVNITCGLRDSLRIQGFTFPQSCQLSARIIQLGFCAKKVLVARIVKLPVRPEEKKVNISSGNCRINCCSRPFIGRICFLVGYIVILIFSNFSYAVEI